MAGSWYCTIEQELGNESEMLIPARRASILWNNDVNGIASGDVLVIDTRAMFASADHFITRYANSAGSHDQAWLNGARPLDSPEGVFALIWLKAPSSREAIAAAVREFSKIDECEWARRMLLSLQGTD
jgi:hypothetical protein